MPYSIGYVPYSIGYVPYSIGYVKLMSAVLAIAGICVLVGVHLHHPPRTVTARL